MKTIHAYVFLGDINADFKNCVTSYYTNYVPQTGQVILTKKAGRLTIDKVIIPVFEEFDAHNNSQFEQVFLIC